MTRFEFKYFTQRWTHENTVWLTKTKTGWHLDAVAHTGDTDSEGKPNVFSNFEQDGVQYPIGFEGFLFYVWRKLNDGEWTDAQAQEKLTELANWVSSCERSQPLWRGWNVS